MKYVAGIVCAAFAALLLQLVPQSARTKELLRDARGSLPHQASSRDDRRAPLVEGAARVIDGDTIDVAGERVRLEGIDAPEFKQECRTADGRSWPAGKIAATTLERWIRGRKVSCTGAGRDRYGRLLGHCVADGVDLNQKLVEHGLAWAFVKYSQVHVAIERTARAGDRGDWAATCETAWNYRSNRWGAVAGGAPAGCAIKGN